MSYVNKIPANTELYTRLEKISMTESERGEAIYALGLGEGIANALIWIFNSIEHVFASATPKSGFKHRVAV